MALISIYNEIVIKRKGDIPMSRSYLKLTKDHYSWVTIKEASRYSIDDRAMVKSVMAVVAEETEAVYLTTEVHGQTVTIP